ncbi:hypothetical protein [Chitinophaga varians]|uniref:hypothetical protein n=1 Tax=Chitinophaga varians TaxID=2202339 RepID=UPI00165FDD1D|nr:hypothetical protein [Chitinophaga varians]MBC9911366.1 hypothetical protein [Chitinophaga varians]
MVWTSCKKESRNATLDRAVVAGGPSGAAGTCGDSTISGVITSHIALKSCKVYKLDGLVYVANNAVMTIEPGTVIKGIKGVPGGPFDPGTPGGGLIITRGARLLAQGTAADPIIFTSGDMVPKSGDWAGVAIIGRAPTNHLSAVSLPGIGGVPMADISYGGPSNNVPNDSSGILRFVRIEYAGYELSPDNSLSGLTLAGVGNGTTLDFIEVYKSRTDGFGISGGTFNASHLLAIDPQDDMFDISDGYTGTITYTLGIADLSRADRSQSNGFECDNNANGYAAAPNTHPVINYATIVGLPTAAAASITNGMPSGTGKYGRAAHMRRNAEFSVSNSIFLGFNYGVSLDYQRPTSGDNTKTKYDNGVSTLTNNYVHAYIYPYLTELNFTSFVPFTPLGTTNKSYVNADPNLNVKLGAPFATTRVIRNYIPSALSPTRSVGAFPTGNTTWADNWTIL